MLICMSTLPHRLAATMAGAVILASGSTFSAPDAAQAEDAAVAVSWSAPDAAVVVLLNAQTTADVNSSGDPSEVCVVAIADAVQEGLPMPEGTQAGCQGGIQICVSYAVYGLGSALSGVRLYTGLNPAYPAGDHQCLAR
jgi:hypothetical protein